MTTKMYNTKGADTMTLDNFIAILFFWGLLFDYDKKKEIITVENVTDKALFDINRWLKSEDNYWNEITELKQGDTTMTKQEFETRYGKEVSAQIFENINALYMGAGDDIDKDAFVKDYKKHEESMLLQVYFEKAEAQEKTIKNLKMENAFLVDTIIKTGSENMDDELLEIAENHIGKKNTILHKIALSIELTDDDLAYVKEHLK